MKLLPNSRASDDRNIGHRKLMSLPKMIVRRIALSTFALRNCIARRIALTLTPLFHIGEQENGRLQFA
ncbi:MAG TPA: hypothetical protein VHU18_00590 [Rhizomicrobium sp.]|nr:hypothetical protein [Rhizomicrobium sp.]